jgi:hypothetical protein
MSPLVFLLIAIVLAGLGCIALWLRHRSPSSYDSGIRAFRREMEALAPPDEPEPEPRPRRGRRGR